MKTRKVDVLIINEETDEEVYRKDSFEVPEDWSDRAATIVASKYSMDTEMSAIDIIDRVVNQIGLWGREQGYFPSGNKEDPEAFMSSMKFKGALSEILLNQRASFNSPVWFNVGADTGTNQCSACFILPVEDNMESILNHAVKEGMIFKGGSGSGINVSKLRAKGEKLSNKGEASGPISFMEGWDAFAGIIKSGGKVRRAAKLVCMDTDHPDIIEFIECKSHEEKKAKVLIAHGVSPEEAYHTVNFQNANHSIRVTDEFMNTVEEDPYNWGLKYRGTPSAERQCSADKILYRAAEIAWETGDPGIQFHDRMNHDNPVPSLGEIVATNPCSEFSAVDNSSCNLASLNLVKYWNGKTFDTLKFKEDIEVLITAMDILVEAADYPTPEIREMTVKTRPLGLGFTNLGALLMLMGLSYDSEDARWQAGNIAKIMTTYAYMQSTELAKRLKPFEAFEDNRSQALAIARRLTDSGVVIDAIEEHGLRNSQLTLLAPTGTISFMMDADTTGIEPLFALQSTKTLAGGGTMEITPNCVDIKLRSIVKDHKLGIVEMSPMPWKPQRFSTHGDPETDPYSDRGIRSYKAEGFIKEELPEEHKAIFKTANEIHWKDHILMMAACQQHLNGAISKTVNMSAEATVEDVLEAYKFAWKQGLKSIAVYRDGCKDMQPLKAVAEEHQHEEEEEEFDGSKWMAYRQRLPASRRSMTHKFDIGGFEGYCIAGTYDDGSLGELFIRAQKEGSTMGGLFDSFATAISLALQYGVPLEVLINKFKQTRFQPDGLTANEDIRICTSPMDYIFTWLEQEFTDNDYDDEDEEPRDSIAPGEPRRFDGPPCQDCGGLTQRSGVCWVCLGCGVTTGCG